MEYGSTRTVLQIFKEEILNEQLLNHIEDLKIKYTKKIDEINDEEVNVLLKDAQILFNEVHEIIFDHFATEFTVKTEEELRYKTRIYYSLWKTAFGYLIKEHKIFTYILSLSHNNEKKNIILNRWLRTFEINIIQMYLDDIKKSISRPSIAVVIDELINQDKEVENILRLLNEKNTN